PGDVGPVVGRVHDDRHAGGARIDEVDRAVAVEVAGATHLEPAGRGRVVHGRVERAVPLAVADHVLRPAPDGEVVVPVAVEVLGLDLVAGLGDAVGRRRGVGAVAVVQDDAHRAGGVGIGDDEVV